MIDLRSDTVTRPTQAMRQAMYDAPVGDDVFGEDPSINELEQKAARFLGSEAALFCPSGTMTNQIALKVHTQPGEEIICHPWSHIYNYEGGGAAFHSGCQLRLAGGALGKMTPEELAAGVQNSQDIHKAPSRLAVAENTTNKGGGACYTLEELSELQDICRKHDLKFHLDGARLWNALVKNGEDPQAYGHIFDSISVCLSKGLGCPVGSLLLGSEAFIRQARRMRKRMGGGMRQAGMLAAAGSYALEHHVERLAEDHAQAQGLQKALSQCRLVSHTEPVETNIVIFYPAAGEEATQLSKKLREAGVLHTDMGEGKLRFVTHLDVSPKEIDQVKDLLQSF